MCLCVCVCACVCVSRPESKFGAFYFSGSVRKYLFKLKNKTLTSKLFEKGHPPVKVTKTSLSSLRKPSGKND